MFDLDEMEREFNFAIEEIGVEMVRKGPGLLEKKFKELEEMTEKMLGTNTDLLDIQAMTDSTYRLHFEAMDTFLGRTLLTGGDVCEITLDQVTNFAGLGLQLPTNG